MDQDALNHTIHYMAKIDTSTFEGWETWLEKTSKKRKLLETMAQVIALQALFLAVLAQVWRGKLSGYDWSPGAIRGVIVLAAIINILIVISPDKSIKVIGGFMNLIGAFVLQKITTLALMIIYIIMLPFGATVGKRRYIKRHPQSSPWVLGKSEKDSWKKAFWVEKKSEADTKLASRGTLWRMGGYFVARQNVLFLIIIAVLLVAVSLSVLAHTPYLAPFVYTIF